MASNPRIDDLRKRLEKDPGSRLFAQLAEELRKAGDLDEAIGLCLDGLQRHPNYPSARMTLGRCLLDKRDLMGARREFESVLKGAPDNILASRFLADCLEGLGDLGAAAEQQRAALRLSPGDPQTLQRLADLEAKMAAGPAAARDQPAVEEQHPGEESEVEPAPIPLASVDDEAFELERPYESATSATGAGGEPEPSVPAETRSAGPEAGGMFEFEMPEVAPPTGAEMASPEESAPFDAAEVPAPTLPPGPPPPPTPVASSPRDDVAPSPSVPAFRAFEGEPPPPWASPGAPPAPAPASESAEIASSTLAEVYLNQGFTDKAIEVYKQVLAREPDNPRARARLAELESAAQRGADATWGGSAPQGPQADPREARREGIQRAITGLEKMLASVRKE